ncbi:hypothetical protein SAMN02745218_01563 [Desulfofundulus australicus DSM 11792]|uniref:Thioredoxin domain-containing protein n=2 Tax=Desulfofundulus australicus TaxID=1566 RepID=A0A1M4ZAP8_9FIRM|nr:hypothetical protein [Desulfofundulus australicus]SHF15123.1 hypothetical protein SAMN02745218_01563 [Desulfofundulus australicus DSM 11792]
MMSIIIEIIYEGDHCIPCVYMLETVEEAIGDMGDRVKLELVYLRQETGGRRYRELSEGLGGPAPIPSIFINGKLYFSTTPSVEELRQTLQGLLQAGE